MGTPGDAEMGSESDTAYRMDSGQCQSLPPPPLVENLIVCLR